MRTIIILLIALLTPAIASAQTMEIPVGVFSDENFREWTDYSGKQKTTARIAGFEGGVVTLEKPDGKTVGVKIEWLSRRDREYVEQGNWMLGEHVKVPPEDSDLYYTVVFTSDQWQTNPAERRLMAWFQAHPQLSTLKTGTHFKHYTPSSPMYQHRVSAWHDGVFPALWLLGPPKQPGGAAPAVYHASGSSLPSNADSLVKTIEHNVSRVQGIPSVGQCPDGQCPDDSDSRWPWDRRPDQTPGPNTIPSKPWFQLHPSVHPTFNIEGLVPVVLIIAIIGFGIWYHNNKDES